MVDSISGGSGPQNLNRVDLKAANKPSDKKQAEEARDKTPVDEVQISEEAISLAEAEATAKETRTILEQQLEMTLSDDGGKKIDELL